jgi:TPR repeat protein
LALLVLGASLAVLARFARAATPQCKSRAACRKACTAGNLDACFVLGRRLLVHGGKEDGKDEARDPAAARESFSSACEKGNAASCIELEHMLSGGLGGPIDLDAAATVTQKACDLGLEPACAISATDAFFGSGRRRDTALGRQLARRYEAAARKGCESGEGKLCMLVGQLVDAGLVAGGREASRALYQQGRKLIKPACDRDDAEACLWLTQGEPATTAIAVEGTRRACELGVAGACGSWGGAFFFGLGVDKDPARAVPYWKMACDAGERFACRILCSELSLRKTLASDPPTARTSCDRAFALYTRACEHGGGAECDSLAGLYEDGLGVPVDQARARALLAAAFQPLREECEAHRATSCIKLGSLYRRGIGTPKSVAGQLWAERMTCESGFGLVCLSYAERLRTGELVERSEEGAKYYYQRACERDNMTGCGAVISMKNVTARTLPDRPVSCPPGQTAEEDSPNHCCFARQVWSDQDGRCVGEPECPAGLRRDAETCRGDRDAGHAGR